MSASSGGQAGIDYGDIQFGAPGTSVQALSARLSGLAGDGYPLDHLLASFGDDAAQEAGNVLMAGLTKGPIAAARDLRDVLSISQQRAEVIARNELLGSYRDAQLANYRANSDVLGGWMWSADKASACIACLDMDGQVFGWDEDMVSHVQCKCSPLPVTNGWDDILGPLGIDASDIEDTSIDARYEKGQDWFARQDEAVQRGILGPAKWEAWDRGDITLDDLLGRRDDPVWGESIYEKSLKELGLNARDYLRGGVAELPREVPTPPVEPYHLPTVAEAEQRLAFTEQRVRELEAMMAQAFASGAARDAVLEDYYHTVLVQRLTAQHDLERALEAQAAGAAAAREAEAGARAVEEFKPLDVPAMDAEPSAGQLFLRDLMDAEGREAAAINRLNGLDERLQDNAAFKAMAADQGTTIRGLIKQKLEHWEGGFEPDDPALMAEHLAARDEFGLPVAFNPGMTAEQVQAAQDYYAQYGEALRAFQRAQYDATQQWFADRGITNVELFRGLNWSLDAPKDVLPSGVEWGSVAEPGKGTAEIALRPITSYSTEPNIAWYSATGGRDLQLVIGADVPVERILSMPATGYGEWRQGEFVVLGTTEDKVGYAAVARVSNEELAVLNAEASKLAEVPLEETTVKAAGEATTRDLSQLGDQDLRALVGAPEGAHIETTSGDALRELEASRGGIPSYEPVPGYTPTLYLSVTDPLDRYHAFRLVLSSDDTPGRYVMENLSIGVRDQGQGLGARIFADEVRTLSARGDFERIVTEAVGEPGSLSNGYYTWARLGYDGAIPQQTLDRLAYLAQYAPERGGVPAEWASYMRISDLMATPEGRAWWKANGRAFSGEFDLTPGSYSMQTLNDYLASHGLEPIT